MPDQPRYIRELQCPALPYQVFRVARGESYSQWIVRRASFDSRVVRIAFVVRTERQLQCQRGEINFLEYSEKGGDGVRARVGGTPV